MTDWLADYDYELPEDRIARRPAEPRDSSRLLVLDRTSDERSLTRFCEIPRFLRCGDLLVLNETRVLPARIFTRLERTGRQVEVLLSHREEDTAGAPPAVEDAPEEHWIALLGPGRRLKEGDRLLVESGAGGFRIEAPVGNGLWRLRCEGGEALAWMQRVGHIPLPPYLTRTDEPGDRAWYQTVYAREEGAVAAPTAGLHFTPDLLRRIEEAGVRLARLVLHVGPGTFLPVRAASPGQHRVLSERYQLPAETAAAMEETRRSGGRIVAVGTTTVRALETAARGTAARGEGTASGRGWTDLTIFPGHAFRSVDALITNFHLPRSSLLLLVSAFAGRERILEAYGEARDAGFRFYSYGDAMLII